MVGPGWYRIIPGTLVGVVGIGYAVLEYIPSIEPPANMRYVESVVRHTRFSSGLTLIGMRTLDGAPSRFRDARLGSNGGIERIGTMALCRIHLAGEAHEETRRRRAQLGVVRVLTVRRWRSFLYVVSR